LIIVTLVLFIFSGCGTTFMSKPGTSNEDWQRDYSECQNHARLVSTVASSNVGSTGVGGGIAAGIIQGIEFNSALKDCLRAKGWK